MEHDYYDDSCFVCSNYMSSCKNVLKTRSQISGKSIYKFIEIFAGVKLSKCVKSHAGICQDCLIKFEEYDQFITKAETIQQELLVLFKNTQETFVNLEQQQGCEKAEFVKIAEVPDIKFHCKTCNKDLRSLFHMKTHSHRAKSNTKSSTDFEDSVNICQSFKKIAMESGINYDIEAFQKAFGFSPDSKPKFTNPKIEFFDDGSVSEDFEEFTKQAGIKYDIEAFHKAFEFTESEIEFGQETLDSLALKEKKKVKKVKVEISKQFRCEKCNKNFKSIEFMKVHFASDHDRIKKRLECPECHKILADRANLRGHMAIHSETRKFFCDRCAKSFIHKESFRHHLLIHDDIRNFQCEKCSKSFRTKGKLTRHSYIHTNQKNHVCLYCSARFTQRFTMVMHVRKQHENEELPMQVICPICHLSVVKIMLKKHLAQTHNVIEWKTI